MADAFLYVVHRQSDGARKVGYSASPENRLIAIRGEQRCACTIEFAGQCAADAQFAEKHAHALLWEHRVEKEWFAVDLETAQQAVTAALEVAERKGPFRKPPRQGANNTITLTIKVSPEWMMKLNDWRRLEPDLPGESTAIRRICEAAFEERAPAIEEWYATGKTPKP
jgi:hypothetical protein